MILDLWVSIPPKTKRNLGYKIVCNSHPSVFVLFQEDYFRQVS